MAEHDFWRASGYRLLSRNEAGELAVTDEFLRAYLKRPEMQPVEESCAAEIALYEALVDDPRLAVGDDRIASLADPDGQDNYRFWTAYRDRLVAAGSIERCYIELFTTGGIAIPPLFIDQMVHVIVRNILDGCDNAIRARGRAPVPLAERHAKRRRDFDGGRGNRRDACRDVRVRQYGALAG